MSGFLTPPTFSPPVYQIPLGSAGQVLTMVGGVPQFTGAGGGTLTGRLTYASPAGVSNNVNPGGGFPTNVSRVVVTLAGGAAEWTGLLAGSDGQLLYLTNADAANNLQLDALNAGSLAANRIRYFANLILGPGASKLLLYDATLGNWCLS